MEKQQVAITKSTDRGQQRNRYTFTIYVFFFLYTDFFRFMIYLSYKFLNFTLWHLLYFIFNVILEHMTPACCGVCRVVLLQYIHGVPVCPHHLSLPVDEMGVMMNSIKEGGVSLTGEEQPFTHDHFRRSFIKRCKNPVINEKVHTLRTLQSTLKVSADWAGQSLTTGTQ